ncbi:hypothetical protein [Caballeronia sp. SBC2]|uniref:hypothetical protein n=1 Tax=Caballeronia sp. SBC2 TaxID=2705547 RepID=UPI0013EC76ED|nr:hypothetical protein [Caballeronia sp. SBC2]
MQSSSGMGREGPLVDHWHEMPVNQTSGTDKPRYRPPSRKHGNDFTITAHKALRLL